MLNVEHMDLYYGAAQALREVSVTAEAGQVTCILGRNGTGKTSLLRAISGRQGIRSGSITWEGDSELCTIGSAITGYSRDNQPAAD